MNLTKLIDDIFLELNPRERDILSRKFGFQNSEETLEDLALDYNVSRERIRQIQENALKKILPLIDRNQQVGKILQNIKELLLPIGIRSEKSLFHLASQKFHFFDRDLNRLKFLVIYSSKIIFHRNDNLFHNFYASESKIYHFGRHLLKKIYFHFLETKKTYPEEEILKLVLKEIKKHLKSKPDFNDLIDFLKILKPLGKNPFNFWGLKNNNFIVPHCLKDKIYLILNLKQKPMHFKEVYQELHRLAQAEDDLIHYFWHKKYNLNSVKNELIKHKEFVLVGRGIYGLREWGLVEGTAKDLILKFLRAKKKILRKELWEMISNLRPIKETSFNIYLKEIKNLRQENDFLIYDD